MSPSSISHPHCVGSLTAFDPDQVLQDVARLRLSQDHLANNDLYNASRILLRLPRKDMYTYHAMASVTLDQVQHIINLGAVNRLHAWYRNEDDSPKSRPPLPDTEAYISIFAPTTTTVSALKNFATNAKKGSIRSEVAAHISGKRYLHPALAPSLTIARCKSQSSAPSPNPSFDFWAWSCRALEWCGPCASSERISTSHHVLPILMHHFGCVTPSHESLAMLRVLADGRDVADVGSGNGYWTYMLRRYGLTVHPVDNLQSEWRTTWVGDTAVSDGVDWLQAHDGARNMLLLLVYPVVGAGQGSFTRSLVAAYEGTTIAVVGTQSGNGYTGFRDMTMDQFMQREHDEWTKVAQTPLPSFAGKDEALFVFERGDPTEIPARLRTPSALPI